MTSTKTSKEAIPLNYFTPKAYIQSDASSGLLSTRQGKRLIAVPAILLNSIQTTLLSEAGEAASMAFYTFGSGWGKSFYERTHQEIEAYYQVPISQMNATEYFATLQELWGVHGLGKIKVDFSYAKLGLLLVTIENSGISKITTEVNSKSFSLEAGLLSGWFSAQCHQDLTAQATDWHEQTDQTQYLIGARTQIEVIAEQAIAKGIKTSEILTNILQSDT